jgi:hypothetical protein
MKIILVAVYVVATLFALVCGWVYSEAKAWSYLTAGSCLLHLALALIVAVRPLVDAAKIAAWCWHGASALGVAALLLPFGLGQGGGWLLGAVALAGFTVLVTLVVALVLRPGGVADGR